MKGSGIKIVAGLRIYKNCFEALRMLSNELEGKTILYPGCGPDITLSKVLDDTAKVINNDIDLDENENILIKDIKAGLKEFTQKPNDNNKCQLLSCMNYFLSSINLGIEEAEKLDFDSIVKLADESLEYFTKNITSEIKRRQRYVKNLVPGNALKLCNSIDYDVLYLHDFHSGDEEFQDLIDKTKELIITCAEGHYVHKKFLNNWELEGVFKEADGKIVLDKENLQDFETLIDDDSIRESSKYKYYFDRELKKFKEFPDFGCNALEKIKVTSEDELKNEVDKFAINSIKNPIKGGGEPPYKKTGFLYVYRRKK